MQGYDHLDFLFPIKKGNDVDGFFTASAISSIERPAVSVEEKTGTGQSYGEI